jgi:hypothetical protein
MHLQFGRWHLRCITAQKCEMAVAQPDAQRESESQCASNTK